MMLPVNALIIHGIGDVRPGYSRRLQEGLQEEFNRQLRQLLKDSVDRSSFLKCTEIFWSDVLSPNQEKLKAILKKDVPPVVFGKGPGIFLWSFLKNRWAGFQTQFAARSVCDIIGYANPEARIRIWEKIREVLNTVQGEVTFIAHSLGTVLAFDFICEQQKKTGWMNDRCCLSNFFTFGSPLALFNLCYDEVLFKKPVDIENEQGVWINIFDRDDPVGYKLKPLDENYNKAVFADKEINAGGFLFCHLHYWEKPETCRLLGRKLALDWCRVNRAIDKDKLAALYAEYGKRLKSKK